MTVPSIYSYGISFNGNQNGILRLHTVNLLQLTSTTLNRFRVFSTLLVYWVLTGHSSPRNGSREHSPLRQSRTLSAPSTIVLRHLLPRTVAIRISEPERYTQNKKNNMYSTNINNRENERNIKSIPLRAACPGGLSSNVRRAFVYGLPVWGHYYPGAECPHTMQA